MIIVALNENSTDPRVAITPAAAKHYIKLGFNVSCESDAGKNSGFSDDDYLQAGANIAANREELLQNANVVVCVNEPKPTDLPHLPSKALVIGPIDNNPEGELQIWACHHHIDLFSMNLIPRISRAQNMDSLSSQANLAGYRAVLEAVTHFKRAVPMMMTAAGMIHPAKILILGAGVAGLQAIATAKRLGAVVYAFDVRRAAKEQVESLGAEFIEVAENQDNETKGGYASEMSDEYKALQAELINKYAQMSDIIICTALIPGRKAPVLLTAQTVEQMKPGSVIVDLATSRGGNCAVSEMDKVTDYHQVKVIGYSNMAGFVSATASELYATNVVNLIRMMATAPSALVFNPEDEVIKQAMLVHNGHYLPFQNKQEAKND